MLADLARILLAEDSKREAELHGTKKPPSVTMQISRDVLF